MVTAPGPASPEQKNLSGAMTVSFARVVLLAMLVMHAAALAKPLPPSDAVVTYAVVDQDLRDVLGEVTRQSGLRLNVSEAVHGRVRGRLPPGSFETVLDQLAKTYGFDWYFDGSTLWVSAASEAANKMLPLGTVDVAQLSRSLDALGISDPRWPLRGSADAKVVIVDGPPHYVQLVEQTAAVLAQRSDTTAKVSVFRGSVSGP